MLKKSKIKMSSVRSFGLTFCVVFLILSFWPKMNGGEINFLFLVLSLIFLILGLMKSKLLNPLNVLWFKFGMKLGSIVAPLVMAIVFFAVVTPVGLIMRILGKDLLNKKYNKEKTTYWSKRLQSFGTMKRQF